MFRTVIFFLAGPAGIRLIPHDDYVRMVRGDQAAPAYAGQTVRVADWYLKVADGHPVAVANETYSFLAFDGAGYVLPPSSRPGGPADEDMPWLPSAAERARMASLLGG